MWFYGEGMGVYLDFMAPRDGIMMGNPWGFFAAIRNCHGGHGFLKTTGTWWLIPLSKWVITPVISGLTLLIPLITGVITHLLSGMSHQVKIIFKCGIFHYVKLPDSRLFLLDLNGYVTYVFVCRHFSVFYRTHLVDT